MENVSFIPEVVNFDLKIIYINFNISIYHLDLYPVSANITAVVVKLKPRPFEGVSFKWLVFKLYFFVNFLITCFGFPGKPKHVTRIK